MGAAFVSIADTEDLSRMGGATKIAPLSMAEPLATVFRRFHPSLVRLLARRLQNRSTAEDLAQEAFLRLSDKAGPVANAEAYLTRTALNLANNHAKLEARRASLRTEAYALFWDGADVPDAERTMLAVQELHRAADAFAVLPERTRVIMRLVRLEGLSTREVAARLDISVRAVEKHLERATKQLSSALDRP